MTKRFSVLVLAALLALPLVAEESPPSLVASYDALADSILALRKTEANLVRALLDEHFRVAKRAMNRGDFEQVAAQMALFANEGDNAVAGIRKRLVEGGHHHNADDGAEGKYESGYVVVTRKAKRKLLESSSALRQATTDEARQAAWGDFESVAQGLLAGE